MVFFLRFTRILTPFLFRMLDTFTRVGIEHPETFLSHTNIKNETDCIFSLYLMDNFLFRNMRIKRPKAGSLQTCFSCM